MSGPSVHVAAGSATAPRETAPRRAVCGDAGVRNVRTPARNSRLRGRFPTVARDAALYGPASTRTLAPAIGDGWLSANGSLVLSNPLSRAVLISRKPHRRRRDPGAVTQWGPA